MAPLPHPSCSQIRATGCPSSLHITFDAQGKAWSLGKAQSSRNNQHVGFSQTIRWLSWQGHAGRRELRLMPAAANSKAEEPLPSEMSTENALRILGVVEGASFDEILKAKNSLLHKHSSDGDFTSQVEVAYEVLLMKSLKQRRLGKVADSSILYADVKMPETSFGPQWFNEALSRVPVAVVTPTTTTFGTQTAVYAGLAVLTFANEVTSHPSLNAKSDVPGVILAVGVSASIYFLTRQNVNLGKAVVLTVAGLVVGSVFGGAVESWLRVDLVPIMGMGSPAVAVSEFVLVSLWLSSLYLR